MKYLSTRGGMRPSAFQDILIEGLAPDGGLTVPERYPPVTLADLEAWRSLGYADLAFRVLAPFADDIPAVDLRRILRDSYSSETFGAEEITPVLALEPDLHLLRLSFGPTLAFKDVAMQLLGNLFQYVLERRKSSLNILGATSGDTGSSAEQAMLGKTNVRVFMLSPHGAMSAFQRAQMYTLDEPNIFNLAVRGVFDDCQDIVKAIGEDAEFKARFRIGAVNSINWARVAAQIVYYFKAYLRVAKRVGDAVSFAVPSGNFGNVLAGHIARSMGLPVHQLIVATNENDVLDEFFRTGIYRPRPTNQVYRTSSPSMDISKASNFERFVYDLVDRDPGRVRMLWKQLRNQGYFDLSGSGGPDTVRKFGFVSGKSTHADRLATIQSVHRHYGVLVDPHTADGLKVGCERRDPSVPLICLETALPVKFEETIKQALGRAPERPPGFENLEAKPMHFEVVDPDPDAIRRYIERHVPGA